MIIEERKRTSHYNIALGEVISLKNVVETLTF